MKKITRQIVLDTETTGLDPKQGHRIIEIGCVELINRRPTNHHFHVYLNPDRIIEEDAIKVHGITNEFLQDKPRFAEIMQDYLDFTDGAELIIHNAPFDVGFLNHELALAGENRSVEQISQVFDTLVYARNKFPGARNSLDALCKRYSIDNSHRELHGALLDAEILAEVYLVMTGGQRSLLDDVDDPSAQKSQQRLIKLPAERMPLKVIRCSDEEQAAHEKYLALLEKVSGNCMWNQGD